MSFLQMRADEGLWLSDVIKRLTTLICKRKVCIDTEERYTVKPFQSEDAIIQFGGGCTAEVVRSGLVFTNHHFGYGRLPHFPLPKRLPH